LFTTGADSTLPEWLYAKMVSGYSPQVPALGIIAIASSAVIVLIAVLISLLFRAVRAGRAAKT
jgi:spermidine/putrescine transport system permease protein